MAPFSKGKWIVKPSEDFPNHYVLKTYGNHTVEAAGEDKANARLMQAAPAMLESLRTARKFVEECLHIPEIPTQRTEAQLRQLDTAIGKARGFRGGFLEGLNR